jgi:hypothetical protein
MEPIKGNHALTNNPRRVTMHHFKGNTKPFQIFAAGTVDGCYPSPVVSGCVLDLARAELANAASHVRVTLSNAFRATGTDGACEYMHARIGVMDENDFHIVGNQCESRLSFNRVDFRVCRRYSFEPVYEATAKTVTDLVTRMAADGVRGTLTVEFLDYPDGPKCWPAIRNTILIVL